MEKPAKKQKGTAAALVFFVISLLLFIFVLILSVLGMTVAQASEKQSLEQAVQAYLEALQVGDFQQINLESGFSPSALCSWHDYDEYLQKLYGSDFESLQFSEPAEQKDGRLECEVSRDSTLVARIGLVPKEGDAGWSVHTFVDEGYKPYTITAPPQVQVSVNGLTLSLDSVVNTRTANGYEDVPMDANPPVSLTYETPPLLARPKVVAADESGRQGRVIWDDEKRTAVVDMPIVDEAFETLALEAFVQYADYMTGESDFEDLESVLLSETPLYDSLSEEADPVYADQIVEIDGIREMVAWSDAAFSASIEFQVLASDDEESQPKTSMATLYFIQFEEDWYIAGLAGDA